MSVLALAPLSLRAIIYAWLVWSFCNLSAIKLNGYYACSIISELANAFVKIKYSNDSLRQYNTAYISCVNTNKIKTNN